MSTLNTLIGSSWIQVATEDDSEVLITWDVPCILELVTTVLNATPTIKGHRLSHKTPITREMIGEGFVWVRWVAGTYPETNSVIVSTVQLLPPEGRGMGMLSTQSLTYNGPAGTLDTVTVGPDPQGDYFIQTLSYSNGKLANISAWIKQ